MKNKNLIAISGKKGSGKDTVGNIIAYLTGKNTEHFKFVNNDINYVQSKYVNVKFADKLKDIVCLLIGCSRKDLESEEFKSKELGEEWWLIDTITTDTEGFIIKEGYAAYTEEFKDCIIIKPTPRLLLQNIGTDLFRNRLHDNIWINSLFSDYNGCGHKCLRASNYYCGDNKYDCVELPSWIITDCRFKNELKAVEDRNGITIRVTKTGLHTPTTDDLHSSETDLDNSKFDYFVDNNGSIEDLVQKVKEILIKENIIS